MPVLEADNKQTVVKPNPRNIQTMFQIFQNVQYNVVQHKKYVKEMTKLYKKTDENIFRESFQNALRYLFTFGDTSANVDRVVQFVATFCTTLDDEEEFLLFIFEIIFNCQCVSGQSVRYRASQLLAAVLAALGDDASLDDDLCDKLLASQMQRLQDTRGAVRCRAALALQRLQNPMEPDDEVTRAYRFHMSCDPSSSVRRAVVMSIAKCSRNVPFVLERLRDVDEAVRRAAFLYVGAINVTQLRVRQRVLTLKIGLTERSVRVRRVVEEILIPGWLSAFKGNIIDLLKAIRLDNVNDAQDSQEVAGKLLESLFKRLSISELLEWLPTDKSLRLIPAEKLNKETAWYWRHLAEHLQKIEDDETLETVLPDLVVLTGYIKAIVDSPCPSPESEPVSFGTRQAVLRELGCLLAVYDAGDPAGRTALQELITDVLTGDYGPLNADVIRAFVAPLASVIPTVSQRLELVSSVISALREPPDSPPSPPPAPTQDSAEIKIQKARLRVSLNVAMEAQEEAVREQNYALAEECKAKVKNIQKKLDTLSEQEAPPPPPVQPPKTKEKISDAATLNKCLIILNAALDTPDLTAVTPMLKMMFSELEVEIFQNPELLENALETVALFGILDKEFARENKAFFFANLIDTSNERVVVCVLRCVLDVLCAHGARVFEHDENESVAGKSLSESTVSATPSHGTVIDLLLRIIDSDCSAYRLTIVTGLCRLLYLGHVESASLLSRLLLLWFNPATADEDQLRQVVGVFFQGFPMAVEGAQDQIQKATIPTLRALANAPSSSPISEIDQEAVVRFIVSLTRVNHELCDSQGAMALHLAAHLSRKPAASEAGLVCRVLALLSPPRDATIVGDLVRMLGELCQKMPDKQSARNLTRYLGALEASERASMGNKMSTAGEATLQNDDTISRIGRMTTSLPQPIGRSTHIVMTDTVEEEPEIDETSPMEVISRISEGIEPRVSNESSKDRSSTDSGKPDSGKPEASSGIVVSESDSDGVSPVKKVKVTKGKKKKLSITRKTTKDKKQTQEKENTEEKDGKGGVKRSRSQRSLVDIERAKTKSKPVDAKPVTSKPVKSKPKPQPVSSPSDLDVSNVTVRRSTRVAPSSSSPDSSGKENGRRGKGKPAKRSPARRSSAGSATLFDSSSDETQLHTIVYDQDVAQSLLEDSGDESKNASKTNVTIPETPEGSEIESEPEIKETKPKGKRNAKKK